MGLVRLEPREQRRKVWLLLFDVECNLLPDVLANHCPVVSATSAAIIVSSTYWLFYVFSITVVSTVVLLLSSIASRILAEVSWAIVSAARVFKAIVPATRVAKAIVSAPWFGLWASTCSWRTE